MVKEKLTDDELFYVGIVDPRHMRRSILEAEKELILNLKRFDGYKKLRDEKMANMFDLSKIFNEINLLNTKLRKSLPRTGIRPSSSWRNKLKRVNVSPNKDRLKQLESELDNVEGKLGELLP